MFILRQTSVKMAVLLHKQARVPFIMIIAVYDAPLTILTFSKFSEIIFQPIFVSLLRMVEK